MSTDNRAFERLDTLQDARAATGNGTYIDCRGHAGLALQVSGTFVGTITWEGTVLDADDAVWVAVNVVDKDTGGIATTATTTGIYVADVNGIAWFRARVSAFTSGTITVTARASSQGIDTGASVSAPIDAILELGITIVAV